MLAVRTAKDKKRWNPSKKRLSNLSGYNRAVSDPTSCTRPHGKENTSTAPASSNVERSPLRPSSNSYIPSEDMFLALKLWSDNYERKCRNLTRKVSRATDRNTELTQRGVGANLQIVDAVNNMEHFTGSNDGTSHKHLNYESRFIAVDQKLLALGLTQAPNHTSEEQMQGLLNIVEEMYATYNASPLGKTEPLDACAFFEKAAGGLAAWDALPADEQSRINGTLHANLCQQIGQREFNQLSEEEKADVSFFVGGGCCMHKDLNAHRGGVERMAASWLKHGFEPPILLMNKDNDAAAKSGSVVAKARAEKLSSRGGVKLCELMGMLLNNKDDKKGMQDSLGVYFQACEHLGYSVRFPDTSNTRYQCFSEAAAKIITNLPIYRKLMEFSRDRKNSLTFNHLELNIWKGLNDIPTIIELVVLTWYGQNFSHPVMRVVRSSSGGLRNLWDMGPHIRNLIAHCRRVIADPNIICGDNLSYTTASMDGQPWERPESIFGQSDVLKVDLTDKQKQDGWMLSTNDASKGWLGANARQAMRRRPNSSLEFINAKSQYKHNKTADFIAQKLNTADGQQFLWQAARAIGAQGRGKKRKVAQAEHDTRTVTEHRDKKKKYTPKIIFDIARFTDPESLKEISAVDITLQCKWHCLREMETDKKTEVPALSKLKKAEKAEVIVAALEWWLPRVRSGEVPQLGHPVSGALGPGEEEVEPEEEEYGAGYGERD
ncbi:hypothetical protein DFH07DRAFT_773983 [Mycena maculata]|uniref:Uncharacterized protein n=1 Tax=Mycena maculata TaxID=230809 RepID=A0AAD7NAT2_9AGAR|nr:hypothetical protein DFH07DRAFT_773983 [Mycena maculata]